MLKTSINICYKFETFISLFCSGTTCECKVKQQYIPLSK